MVDMDVNQLRRERGQPPLKERQKASQTGGYFAAITGQPPKKRAKKAKKPKGTCKPPSTLESKFLNAILGLPQPVREHRFHSVRRWRFDFAWLPQKLAVEIHGGAWVSGGHNRAGHQASDNEKANTAQMLGWKVLVFNTVQMKDLANVRKVVEEALTAGGGS
jgi:very-short-patch-repair endonuclease